MRIVAVIPARMASTRCPGKPLRDLAGKPMLQWVYEAVCKAEIPTAVVIATPDQEIVDAANRFGCETVLTGDHHTTGTDRIAEAASILGADAYLNVQGDEPLIQPEAIDACARPILQGEAEMASVYDWMKPEDESNPAVVKVVTDLQDRALYFSRAPIPFRRGLQDQPLKQHVGLYAYTGNVLAKFATWKPTPLEQTEVLEQLRFMENGITIQMSLSKGTPVAVDTPEQAEMAARLLAGGVA